MSDIIQVKTAELAVSTDGKKIETGGIGSCVVVVLWDKEHSIGGMVHAMLPHRKHAPTEHSPQLSARYIDEGIDLLIEEIKKQGGTTKTLIAKIVGGAKMFKNLSGDNKGIGYQNAIAAKEKLATCNIPIESEAIGGTVGRLALFNPKNGVLEVQVRM